MSPAIALKNVDIVFGKRPEKALPLMDAGLERAEINRKTGHIVGVSDASLDVGQGEIVVLMGLSGSGKSTLLRAVNGLAPVTRGTVQVQTGKGIVDPYRTGRRALRQLRGETVSMVFQQFALLPWRSVAENVGFGLELSGVRPKERRERVMEQLQLVNLAEWADQPVGSLSGGMQQRVGLARAFATGAPILLMDEPFSALDPLIRVHLQDELLALQQQLKKTILFVSHDLDEAFKLGNRIAIMEAGKIVQSGTPREIVRNPANDYVLSFLSNINPLSILTAADVMRPIVGREQMKVELSATARPQTSLAEVMHALSQKPGVIGIIDNGRVVGTVGASEAVAALSRRRSFKQQ